MKDQVQYFESKFCSLVNEAFQEMNRKMEPSDFLSCVTFLSVSASVRYQSFIRKNLTNIPPPVTIVNIWTKLNLYWDFLNYGLLKHVISNFGSESLKQLMQNYVYELSIFKQRTQLCNFINSWRCRDNGPPEDNLKKVVVKMKHEWSQCTLRDVESFKTALIHKFFLPEFDIFLQKAEWGYVCITWLTSPFIATLLQQNLANIETEFFNKHGIDAVTIDSQDIYLTTVKKYSGYLRELYNSDQHPVGIGPLASTEKLLPFKLAKITKEKVTADEFTRRYLRGDIDDVGSLGSEFYKKSPIKFEELGKLSSHQQQKLILIEGTPGVGKTTFSWEFCRKWSRGEILQDHSLLLLLPLRDNNLKEAKTLSDLFYHPNSELQQAVVQEITSNHGKGVAVWLEAWDELDHEPRETASVFLDLICGGILPFATVFVTSRPWASEHLRVNYGHRMTQHVEILTSAKDQIEHYISKAEAEVQPTLFAVKFTDYLLSNPVIRAAMYTPVTAKISAEVFTLSQHNELPPPTTMTELFTAFTLKILANHLSTHPVHHKRQLKVTTFNDLPTVVYKQFQHLCRMAYEGILNRQQLVFSVAHLPTGFAPLGLMQEVPQLYTEGRASSYHFIHLTLQEYLAAIHISQLPAHDQTRLLLEHLGRGHFKMTLRFVAGLTKLANTPSGIIKSLMERDDTKLTYFHFLFEAKDISVTTRTLGTDEMVVKSHYSWTPLDYYVTGHAISYSNCPWKLTFYRSMDGEKFELFCQGCAAHGGTGCRGHISYAEFSGNDITSKSMQSFMNIPSHILEDLRELWLYENKLDGSACDMLAKAIPSMFRLELLWLHGNPIGSGGAVEVIKALHGSGVKQLVLGSTGIGVPDCEALCDVLKSSHFLQELYIGFNNLSSESVTSIITGLSHNSCLTELDISNSHFGMANVVSFVSILRESRCALKKLWLQDCFISRQGASELAAALCKNTTLETLGLHHNPIGVEGAIAVSKMLMENKTLTWLMLEDCNIRGQGVSKLAASLCKNSTLTHLNLNHNFIGERVEGATTVGQMLVCNKTLTKLWLEDCHIIDQSASKLAGALCKNSTLKYLNMSHNHISVKGASSMSDMLQHNTSLEELHLCDDSVRKEGVLQLISSLEHNQTLKKLGLPKKYKSGTSDPRIDWE